MRNNILLFGLILLVPIFVGCGGNGGGGGGGGGGGRTCNFSCTVAAGGSQEGVDSSNECQAICEAFCGDINRQCASIDF